MRPAGYLRKFCFPPCAMASAFMQQGSGISQNSGGHSQPPHSRWVAAAVIGHRQAQPPRRFGAHGDASPAGIVAMLLFNKQSFQQGAVCAKTLLKLCSDCSSAISHFFSCAFSQNCATNARNSGPAREALSAQRLLPYSNCWSGSGHQ